MCTFIDVNLSFISYELSTVQLVRFLLIELSLYPDSSVLDLIRMLILKVLIKIGFAFIIVSAFACCEHASTLYCIIHKENSFFLFLCRHLDPKPVHICPRQSIWDRVKTGSGIIYKPVFCIFHLITTFRRTNSFHYSLNALHASNHLLQQV